MTNEQHEQANPWTHFEKQFQDLFSKDQLPEKEQEKKINFLNFVVNQEKKK